jgi:NADPH-dependent 2,4-dienoyl-CoA reductase/sulfur reductase-like enzyme
LIATGTSAQILPLPGRQLRNVFTLRSLSDADAISAAAVSESKKTVKKVVVIGAGFLGVEAAAMLAGKGLEVTLIGKGAVPFESVLGRRVGAFYAQVLKENKVTFRGNSKAKLLRSRDGTVGETNGEVAAVELDDGDVLAADLVLLATGAMPNTAFLGNQFSLAADGSILVDPLLQVKDAKDFYAAGDVATVPQLLSAEELRVEHWDVALDQGRTAGANMAGKFKPYKEIPFFWTKVFGKSLRYVGNVSAPGITAAWDNVIIEGDVSAGKFVAYYVKGDKIGAIATVGMDPVAVAASECMRRGTLPSPSELLLGTANAQTILNRVGELAQK